MKKIDNPLRIKITGKCNRKCCFCHEEGGMHEIEDILPDLELENLIRIVVNELHIKSIALTGGEPLMHPDLTGLCDFFCRQPGIENIYITSNGLINRDKTFWSHIHKCGLKKINISVPDIIREYQDNNYMPHSIFFNQVSNIKILNDLGVQVDVNVAVFSDFLYTKYVIETLQLIKKEGLRFQIYLLPNLLSDHYQSSIDIIDNICDNLGYRQQNLCQLSGISNAVKVFENSSGDSLYVKTTAKNNEVYTFPYICNECNKRAHCKEGFYGIRLEKRAGKYFVRLCLIKNTPDVLMPFDKFKNDPVWEELKKLWGII